MIGASPCGRVMDVLRNGYRTKMRTTIKAEPAEVVWYRTAPGTPVYEGPTVFRSRIWRDVNEYANDGMGEQTEVCFRRKQVDWYNGQPPTGLITGDEPCGTPEVFRSGGGSEDPVFPTRIDGSTACCGPPPIFVNVALMSTAAEGAFTVQGDYPFASTSVFWDTISGDNYSGSFSSAGLSTGPIPFPYYGATEMNYTFTAPPDPWTFTPFFPGVSNSYLGVRAWGIGYLAFRVHFTVYGQNVTFVFQWMNPPPP